MYVLYHAHLLTLYSRLFQKFICHFVTISLPLRDDKCNFWNHLKMAIFPSKCFFIHFDYMYILYITVKKETKYVSQQKWS